MGKLKVLLAAVVAVAAAGAGTGYSIAAEKTGGPQCFRSGDWNGWKATQDARTMYIEAGLNRVYKLDLAFACPELKDVDAKVITRVRGSSWICYPLDIDMRVFRPGVGASTYCAVKKMSRLGPEETRALPKELRP